MHASGLATADHLWGLSLFFLKGPYIVMSCRASITSYDFVVNPCPSQLEMD